jgi:hypothetical protein
MTHDSRTMADSASLTGTYFTAHCSDSFVSFTNTTLHARLCFCGLRDTVGSRIAITSANDGTRFPICRKTLTTIVSAALQHIFHGRRHAAKRLASALAIKPATARAYITGKRAPCSWNLLQMMAINRDLRAEVDRLVDALERAQVAAPPDVRKTHESSNRWRPHALPWVGDFADTCLGFGTDRRSDYCQLRNHIVLVDVTQTIGRVSRQSAGTESGTDGAAESQHGHEPSVGEV